MALNQDRVKQDRRVAVGLFFLVLAVYIVTYNGAFKSNDERALFSGMDSFIKRGEFTTNQIYWDYTNVGMLTTEGDMVPNYEPAQMVVAIPFYLWGRALDAAVQGVMFFGAFVMAASAAMIYLCLLELGTSRRGGVLGACVFAFATAAWPYSRTFFREPLTLLAYLLVFYGLLRYRPPAPRQLRWPALTGFGLGLALTTKQIGVAVIPSIVLLVCVYEWQRSGRTMQRGDQLSSRPAPTHSSEHPSSAATTPPLASSGRPSSHDDQNVWHQRIASTVAFTVPLAILLLLNYVYTSTTLGGIETFARNVVEYTTDPQLSSSAPARMLRAAIGLTISPYKGLFWFSPALLLGVIGAVPLLRRRPWEGLALLGAAIAHLLGYSRYNYWSGGVTWGSRYMLQVVPFLILLASPIWTWLVGEKSAHSQNDPTHAPSRWRSEVSRILVWLLIAVSTAIQLIGMAVDYRTFEVKWLLDNAKVWGGIGQAIEALYMRPAESPVVGHLRLFFSGTQPLDFAWVQLRPEGQWAFVPTGLMLSLILFGLAVSAFVAIWRRPKWARWAGGAMALATCVTCSGLVRIYRQGDARFDPYNVDRFLQPMMAVLEEVVECSRPGLFAKTVCNDVLIVPDPTLTDYFLNYLEAPLIWYSVEPQPVDEYLLTRLLERYGRVWLARDRNAQADDNEDRRQWERSLTEQAYKLEERRFDEWARLLCFSAAGHVAEITTPHAELGDMGLIQARLSLEAHPSMDPHAEPLDDGRVQALSGDTLQVSLRWQATSPPAGNYTVFLQLLDSNGQVKAQRDRQPGDGLFPTAGLQAGQVINDNLALPLDVPPGHYRLITGLYRADQPGYPRLVGPGGDYVSLAEVDIR